MGKSRISNGNLATGIYFGLGALKTDMALQRCGMILKLNLWTDIWQATDKVSPNDW